MNDVVDRRKTSRGIARKARRSRRHPEVYLPDSFKRIRARALCMSDSSTDEDLRVPFALTNL